MHYRFWTLFFLIAYSASSLLEDFAFHCIPAATGISFMLIIVRVGLGLTHGLPSAYKSYVETLTSTREGMTFKMNTFPTDSRTTGQESGLRSTGALSEFKAANGSSVSLPR